VNKSYVERLNQLIPHTNSNVEKLLGEAMKYKLKNLAEKHHLSLEENRYRLSGNLKYVKENILKLFKKSKISTFRVDERKFLEEIDVTFEANSDQIEKLQKLLDKKCSE